MSNAGVLVDLAENVLAINELKPTAPDRPERESQALEFPLLAVGHELDDLRFVQTAEVVEALPDSVQRAWAWDDELRFGKVR